MSPFATYPVRRGPAARGSFLHQLADILIQRYANLEIFFINHKGDVRCIRHRSQVVIHPRLVSTAVTDKDLSAGLCDRLLSGRRHLAMARNSRFLTDALLAS